jgi:hypothetical protein
MDEKNAKEAVSTTKADLTKGIIVHHVSEKVMPFDLSAGLSPIFHN